MHTEFIFILCALASANLCRNYNTFLFFCVMLFFSLFSLVAAVCILFLHWSDDWLLTLGYFSYAFRFSQHLHTHKLIITRLQPHVVVMIPNIYLPHRILFSNATYLTNFTFSFFCNLARRFRCYLELVIFRGCVFFLEVFFVDYWNFNFGQLRPTEHDSCTAHTV